VIIIFIIGMVITSGTLFQSAKKRVWGDYNYILNGEVEGYGVSIR
jgi:hypothetical protein